MGRATVEALVAAGARVALFDLGDALGKALAASLGDVALYCHVNVADEQSVKDGMAATLQAFGAIHLCLNCAGIGSAAKTVSKGEAHALEHFQRILNVNLIGTFNVLRLAAVEITRNPPDVDHGEHGVDCSVGRPDGAGGLGCQQGRRGGALAAGGA